MRTIGKTKTTFLCVFQFAVSQQNPALLQSDAFLQAVPPTKTLLSLLLLRQAQFSLCAQPERLPALINLSPLLLFNTLGA